MINHFKKLSIFSSFFTDELLFKKRKKIIGLFLFTFLFKFCSTLYLVQLTKCSNPELSLGTISFRAGDTKEYIKPIENYIIKGKYFSVGHNNEVMYAGRMPHYGIFYYLFRLIFSPPISFDLVVVLQIIMESISLILLSICIFNVIGSISSFWLGYFLLLFSLNSSCYNYYILPESLGLSFFHQVLFFLLLLQQ